MNVHIFTTNLQPATGFVDNNFAEPVNMAFDPDELLYTECCDKQRPAKDCMVQCYYDRLAAWCADGKGCKDPAVIAEKKAKEFANRSAGQKRRWVKKKV